MSFWPQRDENESIKHNRTRIKYNNNPIINTVTTNTGNVKHRFQYTLNIRIIYV